MDTKFTTKSQEALSDSGMNASTAGNPQVEPVHLLKALIDQRESVAVALLKAAGIDPDQVSVQTSAAIKALPSSSGSSVAQAQYSRGILQTINSAQQAAEGLGDGVREFADAVLVQGLAAAVAGHVVPVDAVQDVAGEVEGEVLLQAVERPPLLLVPHLGQLLQGVVRALDVGRVVLVVMQLDDLGADHGGECRVVVRKLRERVQRHVLHPPT